MGTPGLSFTSAPQILKFVHMSPKCDVVMSPFCAQRKNLQKIIKGRKMSRGRKKGEGENGQFTKGERLIKRIPKLLLAKNSSLHWTLLILFCVFFIQWSVFPSISSLWSAQSNIQTLALCSYVSNTHIFSYFVNQVFLFICTNI